MVEDIDKLPRVHLGYWPTPLVEAKRLSEVLGGPRIFIKRDDLSGLALGGNKCRFLEFLIGDIKQRGFDSFLISGISNMSVQMAAAAARLNMKFRIVLFGRDATLLTRRGGIMKKKQGNYLLQRILTPDTVFLKPIGPDVPSEDVITIISNALEDEARKLRKAGYNPFLRRHPDPIPHDSWRVGWLKAVDEIGQQLKTLNIKADYLVIANCVCDTQAGLQVGITYFNAPFKLIGINTLYKRDEAISETVKMSNETARFLKLEKTFLPSDITVYDEYLGEGYYRITKECIEAIKLVAQTEGIFLDPVYSGKAMAGLIDLIRKGRFSNSDTVVFIHTGGIPALFEYDEEFTQT